MHLLVIPLSSSSLTNVQHVCLRGWSALVTNLSVARITILLVQREKTSVSKFLWEKYVLISHVVYDLLHVYALCLYVIALYHIYQVCRPIQTLSISHVLSDTFANLYFKHIYTDTTIHLLFIVFLRLCKNDVSCLTYLCFILPLLRVIYFCIFSIGTKYVRQNINKTVDYL